MTDDEQWEREVLPKILAGDCGWGEELKASVDAAFAAHTGLEGLRGPFYLGVESRNCESTIPNIYPSDDPKHKAFNAGYQFGVVRWGSDY